MANAMLSLESAAERSGQSERRLRTWCATGALRCERDGMTWLVPEGSMARVDALAHAGAMAPKESAVALVVPGDGLANSVRAEVARGLAVAETSLAVAAMAIDGLAYMVISLPGAARGLARQELLELAARYDGDLLDVTATTSSVAPPVGRPARGRER